MRHHFALLPLLTFLSVIATSMNSLATPVYLRLESRFPSGHYSRSWLESRTKKVQFQRWVRVQTKDKAYGWIPEDHLVTALKLASHAEVTEDQPARLSPEMDAILGRPLVSKGTRVLVLEVTGSWARTLPLNSLNQEIWIPTESLRVDLKQKSTRAFVHTKAPLFIMPGPAARTSGHVAEGIFVEVIKEMPGWLEIKHRSQRGYLRIDDVATAANLGSQRVRPLFPLAALRSAPLPFADLIRSLPLSMSLTSLESKTLRWGQVKTSDLGEVWWPINDDFEEERELAANANQEKLATSALFSRKIFDMASSPAIPSLKFVSAQGVFRTVDGQEWSKIALFQDKNYPIAIAPAGAVFVGPYISDDHGETFQQWIRWDTLVATLRTKQGLSASGLQILEIKPQDSSGRRVSLSLNLGDGETARVQTDDQGISWRSN